MHKQDIIELLKWIIGAIGGAKIFEVSLNAYKERRTKQLIRKHLYQELASNYESVIYRLAISSSLEGFRQGTGHRFNEKLDIRFQMQNQHESIDKQLFWSIDEIHTVDSIYAKFNLVAMESDPYRSRTLSIAAAAAFEEAAKSGKLDTKLLESVCPKLLWEYLVKIIDGHEKGASVAMNPF